MWTECGCERSQRFTLAGYYQPAEGGTRCDACAVGFHQPEHGAAVCIECKVGQDASPGSAQCTFCAEKFYRPHADSAAADCSTCSAVDGVSCPSNTLIATFVLDHGRWRHSNSTREIWRCKTSGSWSPCLGGKDGYCAPGYFGPRCELCTQHHHNDSNRFFDKLDARCIDCPVTAQRVLLLFGILVGSLAIITSAAALVAHLVPTASQFTVRWMRSFWARITALAIVPKCKVAVVFLQTVGLLPDVCDCRKDLNPGLMHLHLVDRGLHPAVDRRSTFTRRLSQLDELPRCFRGYWMVRFCHPWFVLIRRVSRPVGY